jgi:diketogulonate reductase-like aldo/keto reductase
MSSEEDYPTLYQVHWCEGGKTKRSYLKTAPNAIKTMEVLLAQGIASWMVPVPSDPDDMPF